MKIIRILLIMIVCTAVILSGVVISVFHAVDCTITSPDEYKRLLNKHGAYTWIIDELVEEIAGYAMKNPEEYGLVQQIDLGKYVRLVITEEWLRGNGEKLLDGIFPYIRGSTNRLPVIELADLKQKVSKIIGGDILRGYGAEGDAGVVIGEMMVRQLEESFDIPDQINIDEYIDGNPDMKEGIETVRVAFKACGILWNAVLAVTLLLILLNAVLCTGIKGMLKSTGICTIAAGALCMLLYAVLGRFLSGGLLKSFITGSAAWGLLNPERIYPMLVDLLHVIRTVIMRDGLLMAGVGLMITISAFLPFGTGLRAEGNAQRAVIAVKTVSAIVIVALLLMTVRNTALLLRDTASSLAAFTESIYKLAVYI